MKNTLEQDSVVRCDGAEPVVVPCTVQCLDGPWMWYTKEQLTKGWKLGSASKASLAAGSVHITSMSCLSLVKKSFFVFFLLMSA